MPHTTPWQTKASRQKLPVRFYELNNAIISEVETAKYLGALLLGDMGWSQHISSVVYKPHQCLGFVRHNLRGAPYKYREKVYQCLVRSQLEYCATVWDPTLNRDINSLEQVQTTAACSLVLWGVRGTWSVSPAFSRSWHDGESWRTVGGTNVWHFMGWLLYHQIYYQYITSQ